MELVAHFEMLAVIYFVLIVVDVIVQHDGFISFQRLKNAPVFHYISGALHPDAEGLVLAVHACGLGRVDPDTQLALLVENSHVRADGVDVALDGLAEHPVHLE